MPVAVNDPLSTSGNTVTSLTLSHTVAAGSDRVLCVLVGWRNSGVTALSAVPTFGGNDTTLEVDSGGNADAHATLYYLINPDVTTADIVATWGTAVNAAIIAYTLTGCDQTTPFSNNASNSGTGTATTVDVTSATGELAIDMIDAGVITSPTPGAGQTLIIEELANTNDCASSEEDGSATATMSWTLNVSRVWRMVAASATPSVVAASQFPEIDRIARRFLHSPLLRM